MQLVDHNILKQMSIDVGGDMLGTLITYFVDDTRERIKALNTQFEGRDFASLAVSAHTLKSVCAQYGVMQCSSHAKEIEMLCREDFPEQKADEIKQKLDALCNELNQAIEEILVIKF